MSRPLLLCLLVSAAATGCDLVPAPDWDLCDGDTVLRVTSTHDEIVSEDLTVRGTVTAACAVRHVDVESWRAATTDGFKTWSVMIPIEDLQAAARALADDDGANTYLWAMEVKAIGAAGSTDDPDDDDDLSWTATLEVEIQLHDEVHVSDMELELTHPEPLCTAPADGSAPVLVEVTASADSGGGTVSLSTTRGDFPGDDERTLDLPLEDGGGGSTLLTSTTTGAALVIATAGGEERHALARFVGPPTFLPGDNATLRPDEAFDILVRTDGTLSSCIVVRQSGTIDSATIRPADDDSPPHDIDGTPYTGFVPDPQDCREFTSTKDQVVTIKFHPNSGPGTARLICTDVHGQDVTGTYSLAPPG